MILRILLLAFFVSANSLFSQILIHTNLNIDDGLIYSQVLSIHEDLSGYMWFGTSSGLSRWDGMAFKNFIFPDSLSDNNCKWIAEFADSTLFFATRENIVCYKNGIFSGLPGLPPALKSGVRSMMACEPDQLFIATEAFGLWIYDGRTFKEINRRKRLPNNSVCALAKGRGGEMYFADQNAAVYVYSQGRVKRFALPSLPSGIQINALLKDDDNALWMGTLRRGVFIAYGGNLIHLSKSGDLPGNKITWLSHGDSNQVFVATDKGLAIHKNYRLQSVLNRENGLSNNFIWQVFKDHNGLYYIGTDGGGVDIYRPGLFQTINTDCGLPHNTVWSICETQNHDFYFGTDEGLAVYHKKGIKVLSKNNSLSGNMILALHQAKDGALYAATNENGVDVIRNGTITNINAKQGLAGPSVWTIAEDHAGLIYFGTYDGGVNIWNGKRVIDTLNTADGLPTNAIVSSLLCSDGSLFFGMDGGGAFRFRQGRIDTLLLDGNTVWSIYEDRQGNYYFGTNDNGMIYYRNGRWDTLSIRDGLSHNSILGIMQDAQGTFYLSADNGLNSVNFSTSPASIHRLGSKDGLAGDECNQGAYFKDSQGYLWFGTINGVSRYDPSLARPNSHSPQIHLTHIQVYDKDLPLRMKGEIQHFAYDENYLKFEFRGIDLLAPHKVLYKYRLSGVDFKWVSTHRNFVQYTSLKDNVYSFEVMAGNEWGVWSAPVVYSFVIKAPFWKTWWFLILAFLLIISPVVVIIRQRFNRLLAVERLRAKIAADLHDDIGAGLSEISILSAVAAAKAPSDAAKNFERELNKIGQRARNLIDQMSDIVWLVNPRKDAMSDLVARLSDSFADLFEAKGIQFHCENTDLLRPIRLNMEYRQQLFMILKEAVHNAVKYSNAGALILTVSLSRKHLLIRLKDNGQGFDPNEVSTGNGLPNMKERADKIGGRLTLRSEAGKGTTVEFRGTVK